MGSVLIPADLDPADTQLRQHLIDELRGSREHRQITLKAVADLLGCSATNVHTIEHRTTWSARTLARYGRALGWRIEWVMSDLQLPDDGDVMAIVIAAGDTSTPERQDRVAWRAVCNDLVRIRRATHTAVEMARRIGIHENALHHWEANPDGSSIIAAQRHARGLAGRLSWVLHKTPAAPAARRAA
jgi:DNA-binding XRE family transcriptional regulator